MPRTIEDLLEEPAFLDELCAAIDDASASYASDARGDDTSQDTQEQEQGAEQEAEAE